MAEPEVDPGSNPADVKPDPKSDPVTPPEGELEGEALKAELKKVRAEAASYRTKAKELEPLAAKARELEDAQKTEAEKAAERASTLERSANESTSKALKYEVALEKGLTMTMAKRLVGTTKEELEADADELLESFGQSKATPPGDRKPKERLRGGADPDDEVEETDPAKLAAAVRAPS